MSLPRERFWDIPVPKIFHEVATLLIHQVEHGKPGIGQYRPHLPDVNPLRAKIGEQRNSPHLWQGVTVMISSHAFVSLPRLGPERSGLA
ncbi:MAG: hypothetical protein AB2815_01750 [Candidatus Sedimenticola endophacoides]